MIARARRISTLASDTTGITTGIGTATTDGIADVCTLEGDPCQGASSGGGASCGAGLPGGDPNVLHDCKARASVITRNYSARGDRAGHHGIDHGIAGTHIDSLAAGVADGTPLDQGQPIAESGNSGCSSGPHIHIETTSVPNGQNAVLKPCASVAAGSRYCP